MSAHASLSNRDVVKLIAEDAGLPIESLSNALDRPIFFRSRVIYSFLGDALDEIALDYGNMHWWLSDKGLNMAIAVPPNRGRAPTFDELVSGLMIDIPHIRGSVPSESEQPGDALRAPREPVPKKNRGPKKPVRRSKRYEAIDEILSEIAESQPKNHAAVFEQLDGRVKPPAAEPFKSAGGWLEGFQQDPPTARSWLSKNWGRLQLPPFDRGPKKWLQ